MSDQIYLGDGVYAEFDGYHIWLHLGEFEPEVRIALEPEVLEALARFAERCWRPEQPGVAVNEPEDSDAL